MRSQMRNKLLGNADWWENGDRMILTILFWPMQNHALEALDYYLSWIEPDAMRALSRVRWNFGYLWMDL